MGQRMIKTISYVVITFFYRKAYILRRWSNSLRIFNGNKGLCHCCSSQWFGWKLALLPRPLSSCDIKISVVSQWHHAQEMLPTRFQETAQSEQHWHSNADIENFFCGKLKSINACTSSSNTPKDGHERYVLFFKFSSNVCNHSCDARKDWSIIWSAILVQQVMNYTLSPFCIWKCEIVQTH